MEILIYPMVVSVGLAMAGYLIHNAREARQDFETKIIKDLQHDWRLVCAGVFDKDIFAQRMADLLPLLADTRDRSLMVDVLSSLKG